MKEKAPWQDYNGNDIFVGDTIKHPSGDTGIVVLTEKTETPNYEWKVDYGDGNILWLGNQIGDKGQAVVIKI